MALFKKENYRVQLEELICRQNGIVLTKDLEECHIPRSYIRTFVNEKKLNCYSRGIYHSPDFELDNYFCIQARFPAIIFSHDSALFLHDPSNQTPKDISVTVKAGYNTKNIALAGIKVFSVDKKYSNIGLINAYTVNNREVRTYSVERSLIDLLRNRNDIDNKHIKKVFEKWLSSKSINIDLLMSYSDVFRVSKELKYYLNFLL